MYKRIYVELRSMAEDGLGDSLAASLNLDQEDLISINFYESTVWPLE